MRTAAGRLLDIRIHLIANQIFKTELLSEAVRPGKVGPQVLTHDHDGPAEFLVGVGPGPHLAVATEIQKLVAFAVDDNLSISRHAILRHLRDELVLVTLADELLSG